MWRRWRGSGVVDVVRWASNEMMSRFGVIASWLLGAAGGYSWREGFSECLCSSIVGGGG